MHDNINGNFLIKVINMDARTFNIKPETYDDKGSVLTRAIVETAAIGEIIKKHFNEFSRAIFILEVKGPSYNVPDLPAKYLKKVTKDLEDISLVASAALDAANKALEDNAILEKAEYKSSFEYDISISSVIDTKMLEFLYCLNQLWVANDTLRITGILKYDEAQKPINDLIHSVLKLIYEADKYSKLIIIKRIEIIAESKKRNQAAQKSLSESAIPATGTDSVAEPEAGATVDNDATIGQGHVDVERQADSPESLPIEIEE
jgi:hypothetical protein